MIAAGTDYTFTAPESTAVTDIVIANTDPHDFSGFEWEMHIVKNGGTKSVNTQILNTVDMNSSVTTMVAAPVVLVGSQIFVNRIGSIGGLSEKWLLDTGDSIIITLDDTTSTGMVGTVLGSANASTNWVDNVIASMDTTSFSAADPLRPDGTYPGVPGWSVIGSGAIFDVTVDIHGAVTSVTVVDGGSNFILGDTITILDFHLGATGANDFTMNVATLVDNKATVPCNLFINHIKI